MLKRHRDPQVLANELLRKISFDVLEVSTAQALGLFLIRVGAPHLAINFFVVCLKRNLPIPWAVFFSAITQADINVDQRLYGLIRAVSISENAYGELMRDSKARELAQQFLDADPWEKIRERLSSLSGQKLQARDDAKEAISLLESQGLADEAEKRLLKISKIYPLDKDFSSKLRAYQEKKIWKYINSSPEKRTQKLPLFTFAKFSDEDLKTLEAIRESMEDCLKMEDSQIVSDQMRTDFAVTELFWENPRGALHWLPQGDSTQWLRFEILLILRQYSDLFTDLIDFEQKIGDDSEALIAIAYLRAQALWGLNEKQQAYQLMESVAQIAPGYRTSDQFLAEWGEDFR